MTSLRSLSKDPIFKAILDLIREATWRVLKEIGVSYESLINTPSEFSLEFLSDPLNYKVYSAFMRIKNAYEKPVALAIYYALRKEGLEVLGICIHDLVSGEPAWIHGFSGRDIDYIVIVNGETRQDINELEQLLDNYLGEIIAQYYSEKTPYNVAIGHNLVEIHLISTNKKGYQPIINSAIKCYSKNELEDTIQKLRYSNCTQNKFCFEERYIIEPHKN